MAAGNLRSSEVDRELQAHSSDSDDSLNSNYEFEELFGDDSDADPIYTPEDDEISEVSCDDNLDLLNEPSTSQHNRPRQINRSILSSSSSESDGDDNSDNDIWTSINEDRPNNFIHDFSYLETPGPKHCPPVESRPIDYFRLFFTESLLNIFVTETNHYANQVIESLTDTISPRSRKMNWFPVNLNEIMAFIAVIINMGLNPKPTIPSYWSKSGSQVTPWFGKMFTRNRFQLILSFFHIVDNSKLPKANQPDYDGAQKFQPLLDHCNRLFKHFYTAHQQLSVDESLVGTKSQTALTQYLPNKHHHRWGIKFWVLCDSVSNYCMSMFCYKGKKGNNDEVKTYGLGYSVVLGLLRSCNYLNKGFHIFADNFFTSVPLVKMLYSVKTYFTGTVRKNKKHLPDGVKQKLQVGQKLYYRQGNMVAFSYRQKKSQKKPVIILSTKTEIKDIIDTKRRHGRVTSEQKPSIVFDYNKYMGGIDTFDMMLYSYLDERRTVKYWKKVVFNLFSRMITNSYIIYKENCNNHNKKPMPRYNFIVEIIDAITEEWLTFRDGLDVAASGDNNRRSMGVEKLPGKREKTCFVCTKRGPTFKTNRKRARTVCVVCKEGCHGPCFPKHKCP